MSIPGQASIELPLLLEIERSGGRVEKRDHFPGSYDRVARHFPDLTEDDKRIRRESGNQGLMWENNVEWARNKLREKGDLEAGMREVWEITNQGRERLRRDFSGLGVNQVDEFVRSDRTLPNEVSELEASPPEASP